MTGVDQSWTSLLPASMREILRGRLQLQKIISNIVWLSLDKVLRLGVGAVVGVWIARYLGPSEFGVLNYAAAFVVLFSPLSSLGLESILVRDILAEDEARRRHSLGTAFAMRCTGAIVGGLLACTMITFVRPGDSLVFTLVVIASAGLLLQSFDVIDLWFHSQVRAKYGVYAKNTAFIILSGVRILLLVSHARVTAFAWAMLAEIALGSAGLFIMYRRAGEQMARWRASFRRVGQFLRDSWPLAFANLAVILYMRIGQVMLGNIMGDKDVGIYSVATRLAEAWYFIPMSIATSVFPSIVKAKRESPEIYRQRLEAFYSLMSLISLGVATLTFLFSNTIITLLFGAQYAEAGPVLSIYIWASIPVFLNIASTQFLIAENLTRVALYRTLAGAIANILLNIVLISKYGPVGAALATLLSYCVTLFCIGITSSLRNQIVMMLRSLNPFWAIKVLRRTSGGSAT